MGEDILSILAVGPNRELLLAAKPDAKGYLALYARVYDGGSEIIYITRAEAIVIVDHLEEAYNLQENEDNNDGCQTANPVPARSKVLHTQFDLQRWFSILRGYWGVLSTRDRYRVRKVLTSCKDCKGVGHQATCKDL